MSDGQFSELLKQLDRMNQSFDKHNETVKQMLTVMPRAESKFITILQTVVLVIGALGFINLIDVIIKWIGG